MAIGYSSHLMTDIVAHNYFVPEHEHLWFRVPMLTHAASEWAMDAHIAQSLFVEPAILMALHRDALVAWAARHLDFNTALANRALGSLMHGESALRRSRLPQLAYRLSRRADGRVAERFDHYVRETSARLCQINRLVAGEAPAWAPEIQKPAAASETSIRPAPGPHMSLLLPGDFFRDVTRR